MKAIAVYPPITGNNQNLLNIQNEHPFQTFISNIPTEHQFFVKELRTYYNLSKPKANKPTTVLFVVRLNGDQVRLSTGLKCYPYYWEKNKAKESNSIPAIDNRNNIILNERIETYNKRFEEYKYLVNCGQIELNKNTLKSYIYKGIIMKKEINVPQLLRSYLNKDTDIKDSTKDNYYRFINKFEEYIKDKTLYSYSDINSKLMRGFQEWLINNTNGTGKNTKATPASINKIMNCTLKLIKKYIVGNDYITGSQFNDIVVEDLKEKNVDDEIALLDNEVLLLYSYKCKNKDDEEIRDLFLLECTTGQRFSDIDKVDDLIEHTENRTYMNLIQDKTGEKVQVDIIFKIALDILKKYEYQLPTHNKKKFNKRIKEIAKEAGIKGTEQLRRHEVDKANIVIEDKERYNCISSHTGRRTFITMLSLRGWEYNKIARYSGHSTLDMVKRYDKSKTGTKIKTKYDDIKRNNPDNILQLIGEQPKQRNKISLLNYLFDADNLYKLFDMLENDIDIYKLPEIKKSIQIILNVERIQIAKEKIIKKYGELKEHNLNIHRLDYIAMMLAYKCSQPNIYQIFQKKVIELKLSNDIERIKTSNEIEELFYHINVDENHIQYNY